MKLKCVYRQIIDVITRLTLSSKSSPYIIYEFEAIVKDKRIRYYSFGMHEKETLLSEVELLELVGRDWEFEGKMKDILHVRAPIQKVVIRSLPYKGGVKPFFEMYSSWKAVEVNNGWIKENLDETQPFFQAELDFVMSRLQRYGDTFVLASLNGEAIHTIHETGNNIQLP